MGWGRGSAVVSPMALAVAYMMMMMMVMVLHSGMAHAATYTVGDSNGWTFNMVSWSKGKRFRAGDTLVFNYSPGAHNVVVVDKVGYKGCSTPNGAKVYTSGSDQIKLVKGQNYFICNFPGHCESGTKIAITAL